MSEFKPQIEQIETRLWQYISGQGVKIENLDMARGPCIGIYWDSKWLFIYDPMRT